jgi:hypothetical protein
VDEPVEVVEEGMNTFDIEKMYLGHYCVGQQPVKKTGRILPFLAMGNKRYGGCFQWQPLGGSWTCVASKEGGSLAQQTEVVLRVVMASEEPERTHCCWPPGYFSTP